MLHWKVSHVKDKSPCEAIRRRRRQPRTKVIGIALIAIAALLLLLVMPVWMITVIICSALIGLGVLWFLS